MLEPIHSEPHGAEPARGQQAPTGLPVRWITRLTCPTCHTPEALLLLDAVGTVCRECGEATRITSDGTEEG